MNGVNNDRILHKKTLLEARTSDKIQALLDIQGVSAKSSHLEKHYQHFVIEATWSCNMSYERKFCGLSEYVRL